MREEALAPVRPEMKGIKRSCNGTSKNLSGKECSLAIARYQHLNPFSSLGCNVGFVYGMMEKEYFGEDFYCLNLA